MFADSSNPCLNTGTNGRSPYRAPESKSPALPVDRWKTVEFPVSSRFGALQPRDLQLLATAVAQVVVKHVNTNLLQDLDSIGSALSSKNAEATMLRHELALLRQQVQQLQAARMPDPPTPTVDLAPIASIYGALDTEQTAFLQQRPHLIPAVLTAKPLVQQVFGPDTPVSLELLEADQPHAHLYLLIHTTLSYQDSVLLDKAFERKWLAAVPHDIHSEFTPTLQFE